MTNTFKNSVKYLLTSESVTEGHPDKICDQISDAILDTILKDDPRGRVAVEAMVTNGVCVVAGVMVAIQEQSGDIARGVDSYVKGKGGEIVKEDLTKLGAGDQGLMFGYATSETK